MERVDGMQEQMGNVSRTNQGKIKNQEEIEEVKNTYKMKNVVSGLINRLDAAEEGISELEEMSIDTLKTGKQRDKV